MLNRSSLTSTSTPNTTFTSCSNRRTVKSHVIGVSSTNNKEFWLLLLLLLLLLPLPRGNKKKDSDSTLNCLNKK